ncbi:M15 family metallopeptidase [Marinitenerispora sediminis]|uniref:M15 family metallopeptidase n=1 Tax=Marinitenerispora sediminis TaxID=1931232 RepID=UPI001F46EBD0|nr:M15 family metallopeptidase [Marinitenerispora sediminis]
MAHRPTRRRRLGPPGTAVLLALAAVLGVAAPAAGAEGVPETGETDRALRTAAGRAESLGALRARLAEVRSRLDDLQAASEDAILAYQAQAARLAEAEEELTAAERVAESAAAARRERRRGAADYARSAYQGADLSMMHAWTEPAGPQEVLERSGYMQLLAERQDAVVLRADAAGVAAETLRRRAREAREERRQATDAAAEARDAALRALDEQRDAMAGILGEQSELEARLAAAREDGAGLERRRERALRRAERAADAAGGDSASADPRPGCGAVARGFRNGRIPESALCPLPQPGEMLRADAAAAFIRLDGAFRERFGRPMCVTDSYRPLDEQVVLFLRKQPGMAARPGTSTHGLGTAVDLCGGVERYGSPEYAWLMANAPAHGWHNPAWAQGGFEPWHWEFDAAP